MADSSEIPHHHDGTSIRGKFDSFLQKELVKGEDEVLKEQIVFKHSLGLGQTPNVIPPEEASILGDPRTVEIGWHPVAGMGGKWFAEKTWFGKEITKEVGKYPDPTQHWAVLVGDYVHQLWMDEQFHVIYINQKLNREDWHTFEVGQTRFNDEALRQASEMVIHNMREKQAGYNLISNNCQNFADFLLSAIQIGRHQQFATAFNVYKAATGKGTIKDLFVAHQDDHPDAQTGANTQDSAQVAQQVMDQHTSKLEFHPESLFRGHEHKAAS